MTQLQSQTINLLRLVLMVMVLVIHAHPDQNINYLSMDNLSSGTFAQGIYTTIISALFVICNISVPLFFVISGYLFFVGIEEWSWSRYWEKMKRRLDSFYTIHHIQRVEHCERVSDDTA